MNIESKLQKEVPYYPGLVCEIICNVISSMEFHRKRYFTGQNPLETATRMDWVTTILPPARPRRRAKQREHNTRRTRRHHRKLKIRERTSPIDPRKKIEEFDSPPLTKVMRILENLNEEIWFHQLKRHIYALSNTA